MKKVPKYFFYKQKKSTVSSLISLFQTRVKRIEINYFNIETNRARINNDLTQHIYI